MLLLSFGWLMIAFYLENTLEIHIVSTVWVLENMIFGFLIGGVSG